jgi:hypothetical protein
MKKQVKLSVGRGEKLPVSKGAGGAGSAGIVIVTEYYN